jgi:hypothetical protein
MDRSLTHEELAVFAGLVRWLVRLDGRLTDPEIAAIEEVWPDLASAGPTETPYRASAETKTSASVISIAIWDLIEHVGSQDESDIRRAALGVTSQPVREAIYEALYVVAASDVIAKQEWPFFEWLSKEWNIEAKG